MQSHQLIINPKFSGVTTIAQSGLVDFGGYYAHVQQVNGGGIVNEFNVRAFLDMSKNSLTTAAFELYLSGQTSQSQYKEIYYSDAKLADVFRNFYDLTIIQSLPPTPIIIQKNLTGTTQFNSFDNNSIYETGIASQKNMDYITQEIEGANRSNAQKENTVSFSLDESYHVPVFLSRNFSSISLQISEGNVDEINLDSSEYTQGFVDLNEETDPNSFWSDEYIEEVTSAQLEACGNYISEMNYVNSFIGNYVNDPIKYNELVDIINNAYSNFISNGCVNIDISQPSAPIYTKLEVPDGVITIPGFIGNVGTGTPVTPGAPSPTTTFTPYGTDQQDNTLTIIGEDMFTPSIPVVSYVYGADQLNNTLIITI